MRDILIKNLKALAVIISLSFEVKKIDKVEFVPTKESIINSVNFYHRRIFKYHQIKKKQEQKGAILKILPLLGIDFFNPQVSLKFNTSKFSGSLAKAFDKGDVFSLALDFQSTICEVIRLRDNLLHEVDLYNSHVDLFLCIKEQLELVEKKYANCSITPTEYLVHKEKFLQKLMTLHEHYLKIETLRNNLICCAKLNSQLYETPLEKI